MSIASRLFFYFLGSQPTGSAAIFAVTGADGLATVVATTDIAPVISGGRWWLPFMRRARPAPRALYFTSSGGAIIGGSARVDGFNDALTDDELLFILEVF